MENYFKRSLSEAPFQNDEDKVYEFCRLLSFDSWPESSPIFPLRLAQAGFYYTGDADCVKCFKCKVTKSGWSSGDIPLTEHAVLNSDCPFLRSGEDNISINPSTSSDIETSENSGSFKSENSSSEDRSEENQQSPDSLESDSPTGPGDGDSAFSGPAAAQAEPVASPVPPELSKSSDTLPASASSPTIASAPAKNTVVKATTEARSKTTTSSTTTASTIASSTSAVVVVPSSVTSTASRGPGSGGGSSGITTSQQTSRATVTVADSNSGRVSSTTRNTPSPTPGPRGPNKKNPARRMSNSGGTGGGDIPPPTGESLGPMRYERNRLETFRNWPSGANVSAADLARCGFYYTGSADRAQCVFCKGILRNWEAGDRPHIEHRRHFPRCPLVLGLNVGNVPLPLDQNPNAASQSRDPQPVNVTESTANMESLGITTGRPKHPQYAIEAMRSQTYQNWPTFKHQTPPQLAEAGFFYAGFGDNVKCFYCDGGLRNWEPGDDPWQEHARWFPRCPFVLMVKGQDFVNSISRQQRTDIPILAQARNVAPVAPNRAQTLPVPGGTAHQVEEREVKARMDRPFVKAVLNMGIQRDLLMAVVRKRLEDTGDDFPSAQSLLEAVFDYQEQCRHAPPTLPATTAAGPSTTPTQGNPNTPSPSAPGETTPSTSSASQDTTLRKSGEDNTASKTGTGENAGNTDDGKSSSSAPAASELLKENLELKEQRLCKICMVADANVVFLPCGHLVSCAACSPALRQCPICRASIKGTVRTYLS